MADVLPLPSGRFSDPEFSEAERRYFWNRQWLVAGRVDDVPEAGCYFTWDRTGVPLIIIRGVDGEVRCFYNSCRHRGAPVVREARGRNRALRCQYHSWTYDTTGRLVSVPDERDFVDLRLGERLLVPVRAAVVGGWILVNEDAAVALPAGLVSALEGGTLAGGRTLFTLSRAGAANWKRVVPELSEAAIAAAGEDATLTPVFPNGVLATTGALSVIVLCWPVDGGTAELWGAMLAPDWDEEESPGESPAWAERATRFERAMENAATRLLAAGAEPEADFDFHRRVDAAIGLENVPAGLLAPRS